MNKSILITGASRGIGKQIALHLAEGNRLFLHYNRNKKSAEAVAAACEAKGASVDIIQADLSDEDGYKTIFQTLEKKTDSLDVLINNAGVVLSNQQQDNLTWQDWQTTFSINLFSATNLTIACKPLLEKGKDPAVINFSSVAVEAGCSINNPKYYEFLAYSCSKSAVETMTKGLAHAFSPEIRVNAIAPGIVPTDIHTAFLSEKDLEKKDEVFKEMYASTAKVTPVKRNGTFDDINQTINLLINNGYITGQTIRVSGGLGI